MIYRISAWLFSQNPKYLSILKKAEIGVYFFCRKTAIECEKHGYEEIALSLKEQAQTEYIHAQAFSNLLGQKLTENYKDLERRGERTIGWSKIDWDSEETYIATNLSNNPIAKFFFKNQSAGVYSIFDKLAFMHILEVHQARFYKELLLFVPESIYLPLKEIVEEEKQHSYYLKFHLCDILPSEWYYRYLNKWRFRAWTTLLRLPFYLINV